MTTDSPAPSSSDDAAAERARATWLAREERGTTLGIRFVVMLCNVFGRTVARAFVRILMLYFVAFGRATRAASRNFLGVALGRPATLGDVIRHLTNFGLVTLDRVFFLQGRADLFRIEAHGSEHLAALAEANRGALLLGAHVGSFEALRARASGTDRDVRVLAYSDNARKINAVFAAISPELHSRVLPLGDFDSLLRAREAVDEGALLAMMGDRTGLTDKTVDITFMGRSAPLPTGPYLLASVLKCPVYLVFGIYHGGNHYEVRCEPFAERVDLPRGAREEAAQRYAQRYADRVEELARQHPYIWFNVYDFWNPASK